MTDEKVDHPAYYGGEDDPYEAIKVIEAWDLNFNLGNTVKYIRRNEMKGTPLQDLRKARWYLDREIAQMELDATVDAVGRESMGDENALDGYDPYNPDDPDVPTPIGFVNWEKVYAGGRAPPQRVLLPKGPNLPGTGFYIARGGGAVPEASMVNSDDVVARYAADGVLVGHMSRGQTWTDTRDGTSEGHDDLGASTYIGQVNWELVYCGVRAPPKQLRGMAGQYTTDFYITREGRPIPVGILGSDDVVARYAADGVLKGYMSRGHTWTEVRAAAEPPVGDGPCTATPLHGVDWEMVFEGNAEPPKRLCWTGPSPATDFYVTRGGHRVNPEERKASTAGVAARYDGDGLLLGYSTGGRPGWAGVD